jgi:2-polyprenyl-3-methyl-5-hydroxy-6-metoxy-1,4-benzoquinol methylase
MTDATERLCEICMSRNFTPRFEKGGHRYVACRDCGLERIDPAPTDAQLAQIYGRQYYEAWGLEDAEAQVRSIKKSTFRRVLAAAQPLPAGAKVLDCGAATGFLMEVAAEMGCEPYGVELSAFGAQTIADRFGRDHVCEGEIEQAQFPGLETGAFSAVFMCDYLEHVRDPASVLRRAATLLRPGAALVISMPRVGSLTQRVMGARWTHYKTEHLYYFTPENVRTLLEQTGFEHVRHQGAWKTMTLDYMANQFAVYRDSLLTPLSNAVRLLPHRIRALPIPLLMGEMLVVARRSNHHRSMGA